MLTYETIFQACQRSIRCEPEGINAAPNLDERLHARDLSGCKVCKSSAES